MSENPAATPEPQPPASVESEKPPRKFVWFPMWWWIFVIGGVALALTVGLVETAASQLLLTLIAFLATLFFLVHYMRRAPGRLIARATPLLAFLGLLGVAAATVRIDDMSGNMVPTKMSWRWQPQPDERLETLVPQANGAAGIDLVTTTENDFPQFLGPNRNGAIELELSTDWATNSPKLIWQKETFGAGWSAFAAVNGYAVTMEQRGENELVTCYRIEDGELMWSHAETARHQTVPGGVGPRSTPTIHEGRVYTLGATGILLCLDGANGEVIWKHNLTDLIGITEEEDQGLAEWGRAASPLIDNGKVIVPLGIKKNAAGDYEAGASLVAFDAMTGNELWRQGQQPISYASPIVATLDGVRQYVLICESAVAGHDAETGEELWRHYWMGSSTGNASCANPIAVGENRLFLSKGYAYGSSLIELSHEGKAWNVEKLWHHLTVMKTKFNNPFIYEGHVYGLDDSVLSCINLETGKRIWKRGRYGHGQVLRVGKHMMVQAESGDVALVALDPSRRGYKELAKFSPLSDKTWNNPCLYGKYLLVRNGSQAACYLLP